MKMLKKNKLLALFLIIICCYVYGEQMNFDIKYLNISVAKLHFSLHENELMVKAKSTNITSFLTDNIDNLYVVSYRDEYIPVVYKKMIKQEKYKENSTTIYHDNSADYLNTIKNENFKYAVSQDSREIFTALFYLRNLDLQNQNTINLDVNRNHWQVRSGFVKKCQINTILGKKKSILVKLDFKKIKGAVKIKSDILTNNLVNEKNSLYFWFSDDQYRIPLKAEYQTSPFSVTWLLTNYQK